MRIKFKCAFKFKDFCDSLNKCRSSGSGYDENVLIKQFDFYNSCDKIPPYERDLFKSFGNMAIFLNNCGVIL